MAPPGIDRARLAAVPTRPGCYLFEDGAGAVLYVGKAASLRVRLRSYFGPPGGQPSKVRRMLRRAADFEVVVTGSELEALVLESALIRELQPPFNASLRDRQYPYLRLTVEEPFPRLLRVRERGPEGVYFGPYPGSRALRETLGVVARVFPLRTCELTIPDEAEHPGPVLDRPCLEYAMGRCTAPCVRYTTRAAYGEVVEGVRRFLTGRRREVLAGLRAEMGAAAGALDFERAARLRDRVAAVERTIEGQRITSPRARDADVLATAAAGRVAAGVVFRVRGGEVVGQARFPLRASERGGAPDEVLRAFLQQYYAGATEVPPMVLLPCPVADAPLLRAWLAGLRGGKVTLEVPRIGPKRRLVELVEANAGQALAAPARFRSQVGGGGGVER
jgi:excinuclease ABC subunit C